METQKNDIVPELLNKTKKKFRGKISIDPWIRVFIRRVEKNESSLIEVQNYAEQLGKHATTVLKEAFRDDSIPDGKIYYNIAKRIIEPIMREVTELVNDAAVKVIEQEHKKQGIGIKPRRAGFNQDRCDAIVNKVVTLSVEEENGK